MKSSINRNRRQASQRMNYAIAGMLFSLLLAALIVAIDLGLFR
jgi:hypothetical protein